MSFRLSSTWQHQENVHSVIRLDCKVPVGELSWLGKSGTGSGGVGSEADFSEGEFLFSGESPLE